MSNDTGPRDGVHGEGGPLDVAIDRAVRRMMAVEPPPGLRHRVLARLKDRQTSAWGFGFVPRLAMAGTALAVIILGISMMRPGVTVAPPPPQSAAATKALPPPHAEPPSAVQAPVEPDAAPPKPAAVAAGPRQERLPDPPQMTDVFGTRDTRVAAASVAGEPVDDISTPQVEPGATFRSPIAGLPPTRLEHLDIPLVPVGPPGTIRR
jgi:hypothetical protein